MASGFPSHKATTPCGKNQTLSTVKMRTKKTCRQRSVQEWSNIRKTKNHTAMTTSKKTAKTNQTVKTKKSLKLLPKTSMVAKVTQR